MADEPDPFQPSLAFWLSVPLAAALTWAAHELAHFQVGRWLGYGMWVSMNQSGSLAGGYETDAHRILIAMAGPLVTYAQAAAALWWIRARRSGVAYVFLFLAFFMRAVAFAVGVRNPNDEARTSLDLGLPVWVLPSLAVGLLLAMTIVGSRTLRVGWRTNGLLYLAASVLTTAIVLGDRVAGRLATG